MKNKGRTYTIQEMMDRLVPKQKELEGGGSVWWYICPECRGVVGAGDNFCRYCGQALE